MTDARTTDARPPATAAHDATPELERRVLRAMRAAQEALDHGNWDGSVLACEKVLQELARSRLSYSEHGGTLPQLLDRLAKELMSDRPLHDLAGALKGRGDLGGLFDLEVEVDREVAEATIEVVADLITYAYGFRATVERLRRLVLAQREASEEPSADAAEAAADPARGSRTNEAADGVSDGPDDAADPEEMAVAAVGAARVTLRPRSDGGAFDRFQDGADPLDDAWREG